MRLALGAAMLLSLPRAACAAVAHATVPLAARSAAPLSARAGARLAARAAPRVRRALPVALTVSDLVSSLVGLRDLSMPLTGVVGLSRFTTTSAAPARVPHPPLILAAGGALLDLTDDERELFAFLREVAAAAGCKTVMRVAGGWVRDKLLGRRCYDIDVALDNMTGLAFANAIRSVLEARGEDLLHIGVIQANPEQSKHLETVAINLRGFSIDLVNLRSEEYSSESRIPSGVRFGSALSDAARRDLTINSLFYNLQTDALEDMTGRALADLAARRIDTPLEPLETLLDDPLRVLRAIRFGARFDYEIAPRLRAAMMDPGVQAQLCSKISRERVLRELAAMIDAAGAAPVRAFRLIHALRLHEAIFLAQQALVPRAPNAPAGGGSGGGGGGAGADVDARAAALVPPQPGAPERVPTAARDAATPSASSHVERAVLMHEAARALRSATGRIEALHALLCESEGPCVERAAQRAGVPGVAARVPVARARSRRDQAGEAKAMADGAAAPADAPADGPDEHAECAIDNVVGLRELLVAIRCVHADKTERFRVWVATALLPLAEHAIDGGPLPPASVGGGSKGKERVGKRPPNLSEGVMRHGLRGMTSQDVSAVQRMLTYAPHFDETLAPLLREARAHAAGEPADADGREPAKHTFSRRELGLLLRGAGPQWRSCLQLALVRALPPLAPEPSTEATRAWRESAPTAGTIRAFALLTDAIARLQLEDAWQLSPLLDGNELMERGVPKGRAIGATQAALIEWQLETPDATQDDARRWLARRLSEEATR